MKYIYLITALLMGCTTFVFAQYKGLDVVKIADSQQPYVSESIHIPDIEGYKTLKCDFHTHTIFLMAQLCPKNVYGKGADEDWMQ